MIPELISKLLPAGKRTCLAGYDLTADGAQERHTGYRLTEHRDLLLLTIGPNTAQVVVPPRAAATRNEALPRTAHSRTARLWGGTF
jgi:hypothetical protein